MNADVSSLLLRDAKFFSSADVEVLLKTRVAKIDFKTKTAFSQEGTVIDFRSVATSELFIRARREKRNARALTLVYMHAIALTDVCVRNSTNTFKSICWCGVNR